MEVNIYLSFDGRCAEAFDLYARVLGGTVEAKHTWGEAPNAAQMSPDERGNIMHALLRLPSGVIMGADAPKAWRTKPEGFSVSINVTDEADGKRIFDALAEGGTVKMPFAPTFFGKGFGMLVDRYDIPWMVNVPGET